MLAVVSIAFALVLPMHTLEPFLLTLSSVFVPLFGVILGRLGTRPSRMAGALPFVYLWPAVIWVLGVVLYHVLARWAPHYGSALPTLVATFVLGAASARSGSRVAHAA